MTISDYKYHNIMTAAESHSKNKEFKTIAGSIIDNDDEVSESKIGRVYKQLFEAGFVNESPEHIRSMKSQLAMY